jgi:hypothetical protein
MSVNIWKLIASASKDVQAAKDLIDNVQKMHDNPKFQALLDSDPELKAEAAKISQDSRTIQESFR